MSDRQQNGANVNVHYQNQLPLFQDAMSRMTGKVKEIPKHEERKINVNKEKAQDVKAIKKEISFLKKAAKAVQRFKIDKKLVMKIIIIIVYLSAVTNSIYYSFTWFSSTNDFFLSITKSLMIVLTSSIFPQLIKVSWKRKKKGTNKASFGSRVFACCVLVPCAFIALAFSMTNTIAGLYNQRSERALSAENIKEQTAVSSLDDLLEKEKQINEDIADKKDQIKTAQDTIKTQNEYMKKLDSSSWQYWTASENVKAENQKITDLNASIVLLRTEQDTLSEQKKMLKEITAKEEIKRDDFFTWTGSVIGQKPENVEFFMAVLPAIFIDIVAPIALGVLFGL